MPNKILFGLAATATILLSACGDEITEVTEVNEVGMMVIEKGEALPTCSSDNEGAMIYAVDSATAYFCVNRKWTSMKGEKGDQGEPGKDGKDGEKGEKGEKGDTGKNGEKGAAGEVGTSCTMEQLPDSSGFKVLCGGDSVGVVLNGEKGDKGETGEQGPKGEDGKDYNGTEGVLIDARDKQIYRIVTIGNQTWMAENLNYAYLQPTKTLDSSSWCLNNNPTNCEKYGRFYLWSAAIDSVAVFTDNAKGCGYRATCAEKTLVRGICPEGWHIPDTTEWKTLYSAMGESPHAMQAKGFEKWPDATDAFGFSARPGGHYDGGSYEVGSFAYFWSATESKSDVYTVYYWTMSANRASLSCNSKYYGYSVRCIKD